MRVLHVINTLRAEAGGSAEAVLANCRAVHAVDGNVESVICTIGSGLTEERERELKAELPDRAKLLVFDGVGRGAFAFSWGLLFWVWGNVAAFELVVTRKLLNPVSSLVARIARVRSIPYVVVPDGTLSAFTFGYRRSLLKGIYFRLVESGTLTQAAAVRFASDSESDEAKNYFRPECSWIIPHPYETVEAGGRSFQRTSCQILFLSRLHPVKGLENLVESFAIVKEALPEVEMVIAGSGQQNYEAKIKALCTRYSDGAAVNFPGFVSGASKRQLLRESAVFVLPSQYESFGIAVVEAMAAGLPVIIGRKVGVSSLVEEFGAGVVLEKCVPGVLAENLIALLSDPKRRRRLGMQGQHLVREALCPQVVGRQLSNMYRSIAASSV